MQDGFWGFCSSGKFVSHDWLTIFAIYLCFQISCKFNASPFSQSQHHCRNCGDIFCDKCTQGRIALTADENAQPVRVCDRCMVRFIHYLFVTISQTQTFISYLLLVIYRPPPSGAGSSQNELPLWMSFVIAVYYSSFAFQQVSAAVCPLWRNFVVYYRTETFSQPIMCACLWANMFIIKKACWVVFLTYRKYRRFFVVWEMWIWFSLIMYSQAAIETYNMCISQSFTLFLHEYYDMHKSLWSHSLSERTTHKVLLSFRQKWLRG